jgi:iron(III) transport system substrate-binding protein
MERNSCLAQLSVVVAVCAALFGSACQRTNSGLREVTAYVSADRPFSEPILKDYERQSGVRVNVVYDTEETKSTGLANRLIAEKSRPQADVFWSNESVRTLVLKSRGVLAAYQSPAAQGIAATFKDPDGYWTGFSARMRVIAYNTSKVKASERQTVRDILDAACGLRVVKRHWLERVNRGNVLWTRHAGMQRDLNRLGLRKLAFHVGR